MRFQVFFGLPLLLLPWGSQSKASFSVIPDGLRSVWPIQDYFLFFICLSDGFCPIRSHNCSSVIVSGHLIRRIFRKHLSINACMRNQPTLSNIPEDETIQFNRSGCLQCRSSSFQNCFGIVLALSAKRSEDVFSFQTFLWEATLCRRQQDAVPNLAQEPPYFYVTVWHAPGDALYFPLTRCFAKKLRKRPFYRVSVFQHYLMTQITKSTVTISWA